MRPVIGKPRNEEVLPLAPPEASRPPHPAPRPARTRRRPKAFAVVVLLVLAVAVALAFPAVRQELRQSFTALPASYTELYFTEAPAVEGGTAVVPVSLVPHGTDGRDYDVRVWLRAPDGRVTADTTTTVAAEPGEPARTVARLPLPDGATGDGTVVHVALTGLEQTLHFRLDARSTPGPGNAP